MAAYAAVVSLMNTLDNIQNHPRLSTFLNNYHQIESLAEKLHFLLGFIAGFKSDEGNKEVDDLERVINHPLLHFNLAEKLRVLQGFITGLTSEVDDLERLMNHPRLSAFLDNDHQIESLEKELHVVLNLLAGFRFGGGSREVDGLDRIKNHFLVHVNHAKKLHLLLQIKSDGGSSREVDDLDRIMNHPRLHGNHIESLQEKAGLLLYFIERCKEAQVLESLIASAAHAAEDVLESNVYVADYFLAQDDEQVPISFRYAGYFMDKFKRMIAMEEKKIDSVKEKAVEFHDRFSPNYADETSSSGSSNHLEEEYRSPEDQHPRKTTEVGFDSYLIQLLDWLTGQQSNRQIIPITGMGGIGKTTLARVVYENSLIKQHFDVCAWVTISQEFNVKGILSESLSCLGESLSELHNITEDELGGRLHKILFGRRYLMILDDMWSVEAWNEISLFFPESNNRSRIIVTTRQSSVANHFGSLGLAMSFLNDDESWMLFCEKAFEQRGCPLELEEIGRTIVRKCRGLPLSIVVIGGLLRSSSRAKEYWENVARDVSSFLNSEAENHCMDILSLSYTHLPACLKPCFLHLGIFPEDHEIRASSLVKLWVAEGFINPNTELVLEEVAEGYVKDLVERNLILVHTFKMNGKTKSFSIHDLLRDLCLRIAEKEKICCITRSLDTPGDIDKQRRIVISGNTHTPALHTLRSNSVARSLICRGPAKLSLESKLLRVLIAVNSDSTNAVLEQVNLRFFDCQFENTSSECLYKLPSSIFRLWNLQTLVMTKGIPEVNAPMEIWEMRQLRHLKFNMITLPSPPPSYKQGGILGNLQTLKTVFNFECSQEVCKRIPNIRKLRILYANDHWRRHRLRRNCDLRNVGNLWKLESLKCSFYHPCPDDFLQNLKFPRSLKKLILENCGLQWSELKAVGSLPRLEVLKLYNVATTEPGWFPAEGEFQRLQFLGIYGCSHLVSWNADESHFPVLKKLVLERLWKLEEIPASIGEIPTLERISVYDCSIFAAVSAVVIQKEQENLENHGLQVEVDFSLRRDLLKFQKMLEQQL